MGSNVGTGEAVLSEEFERVASASTSFVLPLCRCISREEGTESIDTDYERRDHKSLLNFSSSRLLLSFLETNEQEQNKTNGRRTSLAKRVWIVTITDEEEKRRVLWFLNGILFRS